MAAAPALTCLDDPVALVLLTCTADMPPQFLACIPVAVAKGSGQMSVWRHQCFEHSLLLHWHLPSYLVVQAERWQRKAWQHSAHSHPTASSSAPACRPLPGCSSGYRVAPLPLPLPPPAPPAACTAI